MRGFVIGLIGALTLAGLPVSAAAQPALAGQECRPPVASPAGYRDCRTHIVADLLICRCRVVPGLDITRRSPVNEAVSALSPISRAGEALATHGTAASSFP